MIEAQKFDSGKPRMDLLDPAFLEGVARVLTFGAQKYEPHNWRKGLDWSRLYAACQRHLSAFAKGAEFDGETGESHLLHAACCLMFLHSMQRERRDLNDLFWSDKYATENTEPSGPKLKPDWAFPRASVFIQEDEE